MMDKQKRWEKRLNRLTERQARDALTLIIAYAIEIDAIDELAELVERAELS